MVTLRLVLVLLALVAIAPADINVRGILTNTPGGQTHSCVVESTLFALQGTSTWFVTTGWSAQPNQVDTFDFPPYPAYPESIAVGATFNDTHFVVLEIPRPVPTQIYQFPTPYRRITVQFLIVTGLAGEAPFLSSTVLAVTPSLIGEAAVIRAAGAGRVEVLDATGTVVNSFAAPAEVLWHGEDAAGRRLSPGIYFCRLVTGAGSTVRKVILKE